jgi:hypothetical protein
VENPTNLVPRWSTIDGNFIINNYHGCWPLCHDDGSNHWLNTRNVLLWGGQKSNMGHDLHFSRNLYIHPEVLGGGGAIAGASWPRNCQLCDGAGRGESETGNVSGLCGSESFVNNSCVSRHPAIYRMPCRVGADGRVQRFDMQRQLFNPPWRGSLAGTMLTAANRFFVDNASTVQWPCAAAGNLTQAQARGVEIGSSVAPIPSNEELVDMARAILAESGWPSIRPNVD